ncbi:MAG: hypothetical protein AAGA96_18460 [Verrucomicrobiota bacterium]
MTREEKLQKIATLATRSDVRDRAAEALRSEFPNAPEAMINTAVFHVYTDGVDAVLDWLVAAADAISEGTPLPDDGKTWHLLYHIFNWYQFRELMPHGSKELLDWAEGLEECVNEDDRDAILAHAKGIKEILDASRPHPKIEP